MLRLSNIKLFYISMMFLLASASRAGAAPPFVSVWHEEVRFSESVYPYEGGVFISNYGSETRSPRKEEREGYILYRKDGVTKTVVPKGSGLHKPMAMAVKDGYLLVGDLVRIVVYRMDDWEAAPQVIPFPATDHIVNDMALDGNTLYVSVTDTNRIYTLDVSNMAEFGTKRPREWLRLPGPNGLTIHDGAMYVASIPTDFVHVKPENVIYRIRDLSRPQPEVFFKLPGLYDGVAISADGSKAYVSDWQTGTVREVNTSTGHVRVIYEERGIGPADIAIDGGTLYVPELTGSRIIVIQTDELK